MTATNDLSPEELARRRAANRRVGWALALVVVVIFIVSLLAQS
ncbi:MAG: hypothetical protein ABI478_02365 [Propionivibrio sp.]